MVGCAVFAMAIPLCQPGRLRAFGHVYVAVLARLPESEWFRSVSNQARRFLIELDLGSVLLKRHSREQSAYGTSEARAPFTLRCLRRPWRPALEPESPATPLTIYVRRLSRHLALELLATRNDRKARPLDEW